MSAETSRAANRVREAEKAHGIRTFLKRRVQKRRTLIVSKSESFYGSGDGSDRTHKRAPAHPAGDPGHGPSRAPKTQSDQIGRRQYPWN